MDSKVDSKVDSKEVKIREYEEIMEMNNDTLLEEFENDVRKGAGPNFLKVTWMRKEILKRMK